MARFNNVLLAMFLVVMSCLLGGFGVMAKKDAIKVGDQAPDFSLPAQDGSNVSLKDFAGKKSVVLYFYPKDNTPVCTKEACLFKDQYEVFGKKDSEVIGVSADSVESHMGFATAQHLPFKLLSDRDNEVRKLYGVPSTIGVMPGRVTYVIDKNGVVRLVFNSQLDAQKHVDEALKVLAEIDKTDGTAKADGAAKPTTR
jgi:peroxiredoxin Q/BCP